MCRMSRIVAVALLLVAGTAWVQAGGQTGTVGTVDPLRSLNVTDGKLDATVKLVDPVRRVAVIAVWADNGIRLHEVRIPDDVKFETKDGKKMKDGLKDPMFQNRQGRFSLPVTIKYGKGPDGRLVMEKVSMR